VVAVLYNALPQRSQEVTWITESLVDVDEGERAERDERSTAARSTKHRIQRERSGYLPPAALLRPV
jgi:hypothetical protein